MATMTHSWDEMARSFMASCTVMRTAMRTDPITGQSSLRIDFLLRTVLLDFLDSRSEELSPDEDTTCDPAHHTQQRVQRCSPDLCTSGEVTPHHSIHPQPEDNRRHRCDRCDRSTERVSPPAHARQEQDRKGYNSQPCKDEPGVTHFFQCHCPSPFTKTKRRSMAR